MDTDLAIEDLKIIKTVFEQYKTPFFLCYGALLGLYRDKKLIDWDDDIDLAVTKPIDYKTRKEIGWTLYDVGFEPLTGQDAIRFRVFGRWEYPREGYNGDEKTGIILCKRNVKFTIYFFYEEDCEKHGKEMVCIPMMGVKKLIASPSRFYKNPGTIKYKKEKFLTPAPIEEYLEWTYGKDWKTPIQGKHALSYWELHNKN